MELPDHLKNQWARSIPISQAEEAWDQKAELLSESLHEGALIVS